MMKWIRAGLMSAVMVVMMCGGVFAQSCFSAQGSIVVPFMTYLVSSSGLYQTDIYLSNITNNNVQCKVTPYDHDGNDVTHLLKVQTGNNAGGSAVYVSSGVNDFDIPAHSSRGVVIKVRNSKQAIYGYALIEWASDDHLLRKALIGDVRKYGLGAGGQPYGGHYPLNNGQPF